MKPVCWLCSCFVVNCGLKAVLHDKRYDISYAILAYLIEKMRVKMEHFKLRLEQKL